MDLSVEIVEFGPLTAVQRAGLYRKLGFAEVSEAVVVQQPVGYAPMPQQTMWRPLRTHAWWPPGNVVVHSLPF